MTPGDMLGALHRAARALTHAGLPGWVVACLPILALLSVVLVPLAWQKAGRVIPAPLAAQLSMLGAGLLCAGLLIRRDRIWLVSAAWVGSSRVAHCLAAELDAELMAGTTLVIATPILGAIIAARWARRCGAGAENTAMAIALTGSLAALSHGIAIDGAYALDHTGEVRFHFTRAPDHADIERVAAKVATRVTRMLRRRGLIGEARHDTNETAPIDEAIDGCRLAGLSRGRFEKIDKHGRAQQRLFPDDDVRFARRNNSAWAANVEGFSVEAGVHFGALDRKGRERLVRYCLRPPIAMERFSILRDGSIAYLTKYPRGRATHRVMSGIECMARLAALVPPPRFPLWRYHGVLASASPWRSRVVPHKPVTTNARGAHASAAKPTKPPSDERLEHASPTTARTRKPDRSKNVEPSTIAAAPQTPAPTPNAPAPAQPRSWRPSTSYVPWAQLILHCFLVDVLACPSPCTGRLVPVAVIRSRQGIDRILAHLRLPLAPASLDDAEMIAFTARTWAVAQLCSSTFLDSGQRASLRPLRFDVTGEPMPGWAVGVDPLPDARSPPDEAYFIDPPAPDD